jgi:uncharacterized protein DUF6600/FecR-like protein
MRKLTITLLAAVAVTASAHADQGRDQSYFTFDDGGTIVRQASDGTEVDAHVNLPIFPGDEIVTNRRGRAEIRLADGNIIALDRSTEVRFVAIGDSYNMEGNETIVEVHYGHVAVQRTDVHREPLRLDTPRASYAATDEAIYAVDTQSRDQDRVTVFYGEIEVRTPDKTSSLREGEEARVDETGMFGLVSSPRGTADEFERWFNHRTRRYSQDNSQYLDASLAYSDADLQQYGSWTFVTGLGTWGWHPHVSAGWRPYYYGSWVYGPNNCLTWYSAEPWGWVPYHYGRWGYDPVYGWVWVPGYTYSPAWVYFAYSPGFFGWAPAGWYDLYRPYYGWAYRPYQNAHLHMGFGFYGRVHLNEIDLRPWTFMDSNQIVSTRVDRAALNMDAIRGRIARDPALSMATVSGAPARFSRNEMRDPANAVGNVLRRTSNPGSTFDATPFFRRDSEIPAPVRDRIVRSSPAPAPAIVGTIGAPIGSTFTSGGSGVPGPGTVGTVEGRVPPPEVIYRGGTPNRNNPQPGAPPSSSHVDRGGTNRGDWRERATHPTTPATPSTTTPDQSWRGRTTSRTLVPRNEAPRNLQPAPADPSSDIPRRIIERIGAPRVYGEPRHDSPTNQPTPTPASTSQPAPQPQPQPAHTSTAPPPKHEEPAPPPRTRSSNEGGSVKRDH